ncbi:MAG: hypothetical protein HLUCCA12_13855 [Rhodobacteraceae bacterium HLUCCA12]|nr:MAG: hypothetical protein HLUCCA12_13855 [Rhodobacteraceae bacterium HLUCCA12]
MLLRAAFTFLLMLDVPAGTRSGTSSSANVAQG